MSKPKEKRGGHPVLGIIILVLILLILAAPWLYLRFTDFPYDDWEAMAAGNEAPFDYVDFTPEAELTVRLDKPDLYALLQEYAPPEKLLEQVPSIFGTRPELQKLGVNLRPDAVRLSLRLKLLGFLSLPLQLRGSVEEAGDGLRLTPTVLYIGPLVHISADKLADFLHMPDLAKGYTLLPADYGAEGVTLRLGTEEARLSFRLPPMLPDLLDLNVSGFARLLNLYDQPLPPAGEAALGSGFTAAFRAAIRDGTTRELLTSYLALGDRTVWEMLEESTADLPAGIMPTQGEVEKAREEALALLAEGQRKYETALMTLRQLFRSGTALPVPGGFERDGRALSLSDLGWTGPAPAAWRPVYLFSMQSAHPVYAVPLPKAEEQNYVDPAALPEGVTDADLGLLITLPHGETVLLYRTAHEELVMAPIPEEDYRDLMAAERTPTICTDIFPDQYDWPLTEAPAEDLMPAFNLLTASPDAVA